MIQPVPEPWVVLIRRRGFRHWIPKLSAISEEQIHPAVIVVIEHRDASTHSFQQVLGCSRRPVMFEIDLCQRSDVGECYRRRPLWSWRWRRLWQVTAAVRSARARRGRWSL